ncbi:hypothetical protein MNEG_15964, partial [Monoraphidium neglectum]
VLPKEYGGKAELRPIDEAARAFKLPPYNAAATSAPEEPDAALEVSDGPQPSKAGASVGSGAGAAAVPA